MFIRLSTLLCAVLLHTLVRAGDAQVLDAAKYPQETPEKALDSLAKSLEANDLAYWNLYISTPDHTQRMLEKYKTIEAVVAANIDDPKKIASRKKLSDFVRKLQAEKKPVEYMNKEQSTAHFNGENGMFVQFEQQADKRWCFNPRGGASSPPPPATKDSGTSAPGRSPAAAPAETPVK